MNVLFDQREFGGLYGWQFPANFLVLRIISYSIDRFRSIETLNSKPDDSDNSIKIQTVNSSEIPSYSYSNYLLYCIYSPLYIAGPIISFDDFILHLKHPNSSESKLNLII